MATSKQIRKMLFRNPGSPREEAAHARHEKRESMSGEQEMSEEMKRRMLFNPKRVGPKGK